MKTPILLAGAAAAGLVAWLAFGPAETVTPPSEVGGAAMAAVTLPDTFSQEALIGQRAFETTCAACHGENAGGREGVGPPLVHKIYEPSHHGDMSFYMAAENGVRSHHWPFGNMPAQEGLTRADIGAIITYVRELQRANGID
jgi:cytochrome c